MSKERMFFDNNRSMATRNGFQFSLFRLDDMEYTDSNKPFYVECRKGQDFFTTEGYLHFLTRQEVSDYCHKVADGELDFTEEKEASMAVRKEERIRKAAETRYATDKAAHRFLDTYLQKGDGAPVCFTSQNLYDLFWEFESLSGNTKQTVMSLLVEDAEESAFKRVRVKLPMCHMCEHFFGGSGGRTCNEKAIKLEEVFRVAPNSLVRDNGCESFVPRDFRWFDKPAHNKTLCSVFIRDNKLGDVVVEAFFREDDEITINAAKREILLTKLFSKQLDSIGHGDAAEADLRLVIKKP